MLAETRAARLAVGEGGGGGGLAVGEWGVLEVGESGGLADGESGVLAEGERGVLEEGERGLAVGEVTEPSVEVEVLEEVLKENLLGFRRARDNIIDGDEGSGGARTARLGGEFVFSVGGGGGGAEAGGSNDKPRGDGPDLGRGHGETPADPGEGG